MDDRTYNREQMGEAVNRRLDELTRAVQGRLRDSGALDLNLQVVPGADGKPAFDLDGLDREMSRVRGVTVRETINALFALLFDPVVDRPD